MTAFKLYARCGHCKNVEPVFETVAEKMASDRSLGESSVVLAKVDATSEKYLSGEPSIKSWPISITFPKDTFNLFFLDRSIRHFIVSYLSYV